MTLSTIARSMRNMIDLKPTGWIKRELPRGLQVCLSHDGPAYRLALAREGVYPSDDELHICAALYDVPEGSEPHRFTTTTYTKTGRKVHVHVVELTWRDLDAPTP